MTRRANLAFVAEAAPTGPAVAPMAGLVNVTGVVEGDDVSGSLDSLVDLVATLQDALAIPSHILVDPLGWAELRKLKVGSAYNQSLLGAGTTDAVPMLLSLPVVVDPAVPDYSGVVVDQGARRVRCRASQSRDKRTPVLQQRQHLAQGDMAIRACGGEAQQAWTVHHRWRLLRDGWAAWV